MKKILILMTILCLSYFSKAQGITTQGAVNYSIISRGGLLADSMFVIPLRDTIFPPTYNGTLRKTGAIVIKGTNVYYYTGTFWNQFSTGGTIDTTSLSNRINERVKYSDSGTVYVTPTMLNDTASAIRLAIPTIPTLYYQTVQRNAVSATQRPRLNFSTQFSATDNGGNTSSDIAVTSIAQNIVTGLQDSLNTRVRYNDTSTMLNPYLRKVDTTAMLLPYLRKVDTTSMLLPYLRKVDTTAMLLPYLRKVDTTAMLTNYAYKDGSNATGTWNNNANTATKWITPRTLAITGDLTYNSGSFDGSGNVTSAGTLATVATGATVGSSTSIPTFTFNNKGLVTSASGNAVIAPAGTLTGTTLAANVVSSSLTSVGALTNLTVTNPIVGSVTGSSGSTTGNAATATALQTARTIGTITGDGSSAGSSFDGTANNTNALTLATVNSNVGTFGSATQSMIQTVNAKGLTTAASNVTITPAIGSITGLGTGVATALGVNVGTAGAFVVNGGALGTPSSGNGSNLTNITATTNANLTGVITSVGNATSIASQTGTGTKFVVDNTPTLITPVLGVASATSINTGTTLNGVIFAKSNSAISLSSTNHAFTAGNEATAVNTAFGVYSTANGLQSRTNGVAANYFLNPLGGGVSVGDGSLTGQRAFAVNNTGAGTGDFSTGEIRNGSAGTDALRLYCLGTAFTTSGSNFQDGAAVTSGTGLSGGLSVGTLASADMRVYTNNALRTTWDGATGNISTTGKVVSTGGGIGYATGAGGTVTQRTSRSTTVVLNKLCGTITMFSAIQNADAVVTFTLTNSFIEATDFIDVQYISATNGGAWGFSVVAGVGSCTISIRNTSAGNITEATPIRFIVHKAVTN